jgi:hypothetical protein
MPVIQKRQDTKSSAGSDVVRVDEALMSPGQYEITPDHTFEVELAMRLIDNRWTVLAGRTKDAVVHKVIFRMWTYDEMVELRKQATTYDALRRMHLLDSDKLDRLKVQKLLQSWTLDADNPRLHLHRVNGVLTDESWSVFKRLQPNIIRCIMDGMNHVLEFNG